MAPHLVKAELDEVLQLAGDGKTPSEIHRFIAAGRAKKRIRPPVIHRGSERDAHIGKT